MTKPSPESNTQVEMGPSLVRKLIESQFPHWAKLPITQVIPGGWDNRTFRLGESMSVRLPSAHRYVQQVKKEQHWLPLLAPHLSIAIPTPLAMGEPSKEYPWHWSIYRWLEGTPVTDASIDDMRRFAIELGSFLLALESIDTTDGPAPGAHNFYRGGPLVTYDAETRQAIGALAGKIDTDAATHVWNAALAATWQGSPVWLHGDISPGNLLVDKGHLCAVIDFGSSSVGDPACDLAIAWTFFTGDSRNVFCQSLPLDEATWARGRGWALWKALTVVAGSSGTNQMEIESSKLVIDEVIGDHERSIG